MVILPGDIGWQVTFVGYTVMTAIALPILPRKITRDRLLVLELGKRPLSTYQGDPPVGCKRHSLLHLALTGARLDRFPVPSEPAGGFAPKLKYIPECVIC